MRLELSRKYKTEVTVFFSNTEFLQKWRYISNSNTVDCKNQRHCGNSENDENTVISREFRQLKDKSYLSSCGITLTSNVRTQQVGEGGEGGEER